MKNIILTSALCVALVACAGKESEKVATMQKKDKNLTCREVLLEQNEAEFYKSSAQKNKSPDVKAVLMPLGYISTYMSADEAVSAASAREEYLGRIYEIMDCDNKLQMANRKNKLVSRQMADTMDNSEDGTPNPAPVMQPTAQPVVAIPQGYVIPPQQQMVARPQPMSYQPVPQQMYYKPVPQGEQQGPAFY